jgi:hypothetical protein
MKCADIFKRIAFHRYQRNKHNMIILGLWTLLLTVILIFLSLRGAHMYSGYIFSQDTLLTPLFGIPQFGAMPWDSPSPDYYMTPCPGRVYSRSSQTIYTHQYTEIPASYYYPQPAPCCHPDNNEYNED